MTRDLTAMLDRANVLLDGGDVAEAARLLRDAYVADRIPQRPGATCSSRRYLSDGARPF